MAGGCGRRATNPAPEPGFRAFDAEDPSPGMSERGRKAETAPGHPPILVPRLPGDWWHPSVRLLGEFREYLLPVLQEQREIYCLPFPPPSPVDLDLAFLGPISFEPQLPCKAEYYLHFIKEASRVQKGEMSYPHSDHHQGNYPASPGSWPG